MQLVEFCRLVPPERPLQPPLHTISQRPVFHQLRETTGQLNERTLTDMPPTPRRRSGGDGASLNFMPSSGQPRPSSAQTSMTWAGTRMGVMVWLASAWVMKSINPVVEKIWGTPSSAA